MPTHTNLAKIKPAIWIGMICILFITTALLQCAQAEKKLDCGCQRLDKAYGSLYILFERTGLAIEDKKTEPAIWLRLRNNTTCPVTLRTTGYRYLFDGKIRWDVLEGEEIGVYFEFQKGETREIYEYRDNFALVRLQPGISVIFKVPARYFKVKRFICVPVEYEWEVGGTRHEVLFRTDMLPRGWEKIISPTTSKSSKD